MKILKVWEKYSWIMQNSLKHIMNDKEFLSLKVLKAKYRRVDQIIQPLCRIDSHQEIRSPFFNFWKFLKSNKSTPESCRIYWNLMNDIEFGSVKLLKLKYRRGDQIIQLFCGIGFPPKSQTSTPESHRKHWNVMNDKEFWSLKVLKLKYRMGYQNIWLFPRFCFPLKIRSPRFNL